MIPAPIETSAAQKPFRLVGTTPQATPGTQSPAPAIAEPQAQAALQQLGYHLRCNTEQCRIIRARLMTQPARASQICTITSAGSGEGRTTTTLGMALSFAELSGRRVLALEADPHTPRFAHMLNLPLSPGLTDWLGGRCDLDDALIPIAGGAMTAMHAGHERGNRLAEHLVAPATRARFDELRERFDHVLIDTPAVSRAAEPGLIGALSDQVLMLVRMGQTARPAIDRAIRVLEGFGARPTAAILTGAKAN